MNLIHRILGQALDTVQNQPVEQQLNIIFDVFSSPVAIALKHVNVRKILQQAILTQNYSYAVPYELFASEMKSDKYYLSDTIYICDSVSTYYPVIWDNHKGMVSRVYNDDTGEYDMIAVEDMIY